MSYSILFSTKQIMVLIDKLKRALKKVHSHPNKVTFLYNIVIVLIQFVSGAAQTDITIKSIECVMLYYCILYI